MSKNFKGYMGDQIGKLGTAVGRRWMGLMVYAAYQGKVKNPRTESQQLVRARMALLGRMSGALQVALNVGLRQSVKGKNKTVGNRFVELNYSNVLGDQAGALTIAYEAMLLSVGPLTGLKFGEAKFSTPGAVSVKVVDSGIDTQEADASDKVYLVGYCPERGRAVVSSKATRSDSELTLSVPTGWAGQTIHVWGFAVGAKGIASDSVYIGSGELS